MRLTILGSGTSSGVPVIGCRCPVCVSSDARNQRTRSSALVEKGGRCILIDTSPDLRQQALRFGIARVDAVLFTHGHADHVHGIDELRSFNLVALSDIPCFGNEPTLSRLRRTFDYIFQDTGGESLKPFLSLTEVNGPFEAAGVPVVPVPLWHGKTPALGYRIGDVAYLTDCSRIPEDSLGLLSGLRLLVLDALRHHPHPTHLSIAQAVELVERLRPARAVLTHLSHQVEHAETQSRLPLGVELAYDGMSFEICESIG
ncbi:MAG: MBL fold metallo-hydrolase [Myxococcales bacterium]|nr:MBL fold metallo-hydrolase [Myxococcales bacterium]